MTALAEVVNKVDQSSRHDLAHSSVTYINFKMIPANCKTKLPEFKVQFVEGEPLGTQLQVKTLKVVNAICAVQYISFVVQAAIYTQSVSPFHKVISNRASQQKAE
jgi:hypothetical protein